MAPDALYRALHPFADPFDFITASECYPMLADGYRSDTARMETLKPNWEMANGAIYILPCASWARRISGVFANTLASREETRSFAVLTESTDGTYVVSVRSGKPLLRSANGFCGQFPTGGGRRGAAGINSLPASGLDCFVKAFSEYFGVGEKVCNGMAHAYPM